MSFHLKESAAAILEGLLVILLGHIVINCCVIGTPLLMAVVIGIGFVDAFGQAVIPTVLYAAPIHELYWAEGSHAHKRRVSIPKIISGHFIIVLFFINNVHAA